MNGGGSCFPENHSVLAKVGVPFRGVLEHIQEHQRPAGSTLQSRAQQRGEKEEERVWQLVSDGCDGLKV